MQIEQIALATVSALTYSLVFYAKTKASDPDEEINYYKLGATLAVGAGVGAFYGFAGVDFTQTDISTQLTAYAGTVAIVESLMKVAWRQYIRDIVNS